MRSRRRQLGLSQEALAERAELHRTYVCDVERGVRNLSLQSIEKLARALQTSVSSLFPSAGGHWPADSAPVEILLVEDNPDDVVVTLRAFKTARFLNHVHVVNDGAEALDYVFCRGKYAERNAAPRPFVVLLDLNLPKINGIEVLRRMKADPQTKDIPTIILTVSQKSEDIAECQKLGAFSYIVKPVDLSKLIRATSPHNLNWALLKSSEAKVAIFA